MPGYDASLRSLVNPSWMPTLLDRNWLGQPADAILLECARLTYFEFESRPEKRIELLDALAVLDAGDPELFSIAATDTQAFAFAWPATGQAVISFRGSEPKFHDVVGVDLHAEHADWNPRPGVAGGRVHAGFAAAFESIAADPGFSAWMTRHQALKLALTGHSLGAALATLGASRWKAERLVTMGSPRVGDAHFTATLTGTEVRRYVDCCDSVTDLPPSWFGYEHVSEEIYIDSSGQLGTGVNTAVDRSTARLAYPIEYLRLESAPTRGLADHAPINYLRAWF